VKRFISAGTAPDRPAHIRTMSLIRQRPLLLSLRHSHQSPAMSPAHSPLRRVTDTPLPPAGAPYVAVRLLTAHALPPSDCKMLSSTASDYSPAARPLSA